MRHQPHQCYTIHSRPISTGNRQGAPNHISVTQSVAGPFLQEVDKVPPTASVLHNP